MATWSYRCPECQGWVQSEAGKLKMHLKVRLSGNRLQRDWCAGSGRVAT